MLEEHIPNTPTEQRVLSNDFEAVEDFDELKDTENEPSGQLAFSADGQIDDAYEDFIFTSFGDQDSLLGFTESEVISLVEETTNTNENDAVSREVIGGQSNEQPVAIIDENRKDNDTAGSSFSVPVRMQFLKRMNLKLLVQSSHFSIRKYNFYCDILKGRFRETLAGQSQTALSRRCRRVAADYELVNNRLYKKSKESISGRVLVAKVDELVDVVDRYHMVRGHRGFNLTWISLQKEFTGVSCYDVLWLLNRCSTCAIKRANSTRAPLKPIVSTYPMERVQMDLMDLRNKPSNGFTWILHLKDHFTKMSWLYALKGKHQFQLPGAFSSLFGIVVRHT